MYRARTIVARLSAGLLVAALAVAILHQHPTWDSTEQRSQCPAAVWHAGAVLHGSPAPGLALAIFTHPAPVDTTPTPPAQLGITSRTSRAPPCS